MKQTIEIEVPDGFIAKWNEEEKKVEIIEKDELPTTWEEYMKCVQHNPSYEAGFNEPFFCRYRNANGYAEFQTKETAEAFSALGKLIQLRDEWWRQLNWKPDWTDGKTEKYSIEVVHNKVYTNYYRHLNRILAFPTKEMRDKFLVCFGELIETAKPLL